MSSTRSGGLVERPARWRSLLLISAEITEITLRSHKRLVRRQKTRLRGRPVEKKNSSSGTHDSRNGCVPAPRSPGRRAWPRRRRVHACQAFLRQPLGQTEGRLCVRSLFRYVFNDVEQCLTTALFTARADGRSESLPPLDFCKACLWQVIDASIDLRDPNTN